MKLPATHQYRLELLYFAGCPNLQVLRSVLLEEGVAPVQEIDLNSLPEGSLLKNFSSPTLLLDGEILIGSKTMENSACCSYLSLDEMRIIARKVKGRIAVEP